MKKISLVILLVVSVMLTGCKNANDKSFDEYLDSKYPRIVYQRNYWTFDNMEIPILDGYTIDQGHPYECVETEDGYDLIIHFVKGGK